MDTADVPSESQSATELLRLDIANISTAAMVSKTHHGRAQSAHSPYRLLQPRH